MKNEHHARCRLLVRTSPVGTTAEIRSGHGGSSGVEDADGSGGGLAVMARGRHRFRLVEDLGWRWVCRQRAFGLPASVFWTVEACMQTRSRGVAVRQGAVCEVRGPVARSSTAEFGCVEVSLGCSSRRGLY